MPITLGGHGLELCEAIEAHYYGKSFQWPKQKLIIKPDCTSKLISQGYLTPQLSLLSVSVYLLLRVNRV